MYFIYELIDPQTGETGYVGITNNPNLRYQQHLGGRERNGRKNAWLQQLLGKGVEPKMRILETVDDKKQALERETYWVRRLIRQGVHLTNIRGIPYEEPGEPQTSIYYTASEAEEVLGVDFCLFVTLRDKGLITPVGLH